jgi:hypothetical protein
MWLLIPQDFNLRDRCWPSSCQEGLLVAVDDDTIQRLVAIDEETQFEYLAHPLTPDGIAPSMFCNK